MDGLSKDVVQTRVKKLGKASVYPVVQKVKIAPVRTLIWKVIAFGGGANPPEKDAIS